MIEIVANSPELIAAGIVQIVLLLVLITTEVQDE